MLDVIELLRPQNFVYWAKTLRSAIDKRKVPTSVIRWDFSFRNRLFRDYRDEPLSGIIDAAASGHSPRSYLNPLSKSVILVFIANILMKLLKNFLIPVCLQGLAAIVWFLSSRSETENAVLFGLSTYRLVLVGVQIGLVLLVIGLTVWLWRSPSACQAILRSLDSWCLERKKLVPTLLALFFLQIWLLSIAIIVAKMPLVGNIYELVKTFPFPFLKLVLLRIAPLYTWLLLILFGVSLFLALRYRKVITKPGYFQWKWIRAGLLVYFLLTAAFLHWLILGFQLRLFVNIPAWYWVITSNPFTLRDIFFAIAAVILLGLICWLFLGRRQIRSGLILVFLTGCLLQYGIGFLEGNTFQSLHDRYFTKHHRTYVNKASQDTLPILQMVRDYDNVYGNRMFTSTKPPGMMVFFVSLDRLVNGNPSPFPSDVRFQRLSWTITYLFPLVAMSLVFLLYLFARRFLSGSTGMVGIISPILLITCPNILLLSLYMDQAVYPVLFLAGAWLSIEVVRRQSLLGAFLLGMLLYTMIFFAFTMLPLYPFVGIMLLIYYLMHRKQIPLRRQIAIGIMIAAGTVLVYLLFLLVFDYNFFDRFTTTVTINHNFDFYERVRQPLPTAPEPTAVRMQQSLRAAWTNNLEFATGVGFPLYILFLFQAGNLIVRTFLRNHRPGDQVLLAFLLSFLLLNIAGTAQGEVARLWMFWIPMILYFAAYEIENWVSRRPIILFGILLLQLVTVLLTYHYQDLVM